MVNKILFYKIDFSPKDEVSILLPLIRIIGSLLTGKEKDVEVFVNIKSNFFTFLFSILLN